MTKILFYLQFFAILLIFVFPPIFVKNAPSEGLDFGKFNFFALLSFFLGLVILLQKKANEKAKGLGGEKKGFLAFAIYSSKFWIAFGSLLLCGIIFNLTQEAFWKTKAFSVIMPQNVLGFFFCAATLFFSAFYEECLYRHYLQFSLKKILFEDCPFFSSTEIKQKGFNKEKIAIALVEIACASLFAFAHRWQGPFAVANAFAGAAILRLCAIKSKSLGPGIAAHFLYNCAALAFSLA